MLLFNATIIHVHCNILCATFTCHKLLYQLPMQHAKFIHFSNFVSISTTNIKLGHLFYLCITIIIFSTTSNAIFSVLKRFTIKTCKEMLSCLKQVDTPTTTFVLVMFLYLLYHFALYFCHSIFFHIVVCVNIYVHVDQNNLFGQ